MSTDNDLGSKDRIEDVLRAHAPHPLVRQLNRKAIVFVLLAVTLIFAGRLIMGIFDRHAERNAGEREQPKIRGDEGVAERSLSHLPSNYDFLLRRPAPPPMPEPLPQIEIPAQAAVDSDDSKRREALRREQELADNSPIQFSNVQPLTPKSKEPASFECEHFDGDTQFDRLIEHGGRPFDARRRDFFRDAAQVPTYVRSRLLPQRSPYEIKAGTIIPAALITAINSDLPGDAIGQVTSNIYDHVSGRFLLIPQGTRLIGRYDSEVLKGHNRVLIAWQRLILPNGHSISLEAMPGTDGSGVAGMADQVDWHANRLAGATLVSTLTSLAGNFAANIGQDKQALATVGQTVAQDAARVGQRVIDRELDLAPTILISAGMPFNVLVNKDLEMKPYTPVITRR